MITSALWRSCHVSSRMWDRLNRLSGRARTFVRENDKGQGAARLGSSFPGREEAVSSRVPIAEAVGFRGRIVCGDTVSGATTTRSSGAPSILGSRDRFHPVDCSLCPLEASSLQSDSMIESTAFDVSAPLEPCPPSWSPLCAGGAGADGDPVGLPDAR